MAKKNPIGFGADRSGSGAEENQNDRSETPYNHTEILKKLVDYLDRRYEPVATIADADLYPTSSQLLNALKDIIPMDMNEIELYDLLIKKGYQFENIGGSGEPRLRWLMKERRRAE